MSSLEVGSCASGCKEPDGDIAPGRAAGVHVERIRESILPAGVFELDLGRRTPPSPDLGTPPPDLGGGSRQSLQTPLGR